jgi:hypothetical protein
MTNDQNPNPNEIPMSKSQIPKEFNFQRSTSKVRQYDHGGAEGTPVAPHRLRDSPTSLNLNFEF